MKTCNRCGRVKAIDQFDKASGHSKDGYMTLCKTCRVEYDRLRREKKKARNLEYYRANREKQKARSREHSITGSGIFSRLMGSRNLVLVEREAFVEWYDKQPKACAYCDITMPDIPVVQAKISNTARISRRLEVDRKDSSLPYTIDNIILACRICNLHKKEFFSYDDFRQIAQKYIKPKWLELRDRVTDGLSLTAICLWG